MSRSTFTLGKDVRLSYLVGAPSPRPAQRNPQTTFELRDPPGADDLINERTPPSTGTVQPGDYVFTVTESQVAEVRLPAGGVVTVRAA